MRLQQALQALQASTPLAYNHHALKDFQCEWEGPKVGHEELVEKDGVMVYQQVRCGDALQHGVPCAVCLHCLPHTLYMRACSPLRGWPVAIFF